MSTDRASVAIEARSLARTCTLLPPTQGAAAVAAVDVVADPAEVRRRIGVALQENVHARDLAVGVLSLRAIATHDR